MPLADTFIQSDSGYIFVLSACVFPGNRTHNLYAANAILEPLSHRNIGFYRFKGGGEHCTSASLHSDTVEDLIRISVEGSSLEDFDARESVASWFSRGQRSKRPNYRSGPPEGHVTAMEDSP